MYHSTSTRTLEGTKRVESLDLVGLDVHLVLIFPGTAVSKRVLRCLQ